MACRKICCCDWSEDRNKELNKGDSVEMGQKSPTYSPSSNYGRDQRTGSLISNNGNNSISSTTASGGSNNNSGAGNNLNAPLMSPSLSHANNSTSSIDPLNGTLSGNDGLPMSPLALNHNASFRNASLVSPSGGSNNSSARRRGVSFAPKGFEQPKATTTSMQPNGHVRGIYKHNSSYGPDGMSMSNAFNSSTSGAFGNSSANMMLDAGSGSSPRLVSFGNNSNKLSPHQHSSSTQQALGSPYGGDATGGREPPDLSLL